MGTENIGQRQFDQVTDRHAQQFLSLFMKHELTHITALARSRIPFVGQEIGFEDLICEWTQQPPGKPNPTVFPDALGVVVQVLLQVRDDLF